MKSLAASTFTLFIVILQPYVSNANGCNSTCNISNILQSEFKLKYVTIQCLTNLLCFNAVGSATGRAFVILAVRVVRVVFVFLCIVYFFVSVCLNFLCLYNLAVWFKEIDIQLHVQTLSASNKQENKARTRRNSWQNVHEKSILYLY